MKFFFACYCFGGANGESMIGVYKRGVRIAVELERRGHDVTMFCPGRQFFRDALTETAERELEFIEFEHGGTRRRRRRAFERAIARAAPDVVVIGEAPLSGNFLTMTHAATFRRLPVIILDNAYSVSVTAHFLRDHGSIADGIVLTGLPPCEVECPPAGLCQVPPFVHASTEAARVLLERRGREADALVTVLGYDERTARLGLSLLDGLDAPWRTGALIVTDPDRWRGEIDRLRRSTRSRIVLLRPPADPELFGLIEESRLVVAKYGFMQLTECLALGTPAVLAYRGGLPWREFLPTSVRRFAVPTGDDTADEEILAEAARLFSASAADLAGIRPDPGLDAAERAADFLETAGGTTSAIRDPRGLGFGRQRVRAALARLHGTESVVVEDVRATLIHRVPGRGDVFSVPCRYRVGPWPQRTLLWGRRYVSVRAAERDYRRATREPSDRRVLCFSARSRRMIEVDAGERVLREWS